MLADSRFQISRSTFTGWDYPQQLQWARKHLPDDYYGVLLGQPVGREQQATVNVDSPQALVAACLQLFAGAGTEQLDVAVLKPFVLSGIFFSQHPGRPDVALAVMEGGGRYQEKSRLFVDGSGSVRWCHPEDTPLLDIPAQQIRALQAFLARQSRAPLAAEWTWDGQQLAVVQWFPILSLPEPREAWSCRTLLGFSPQVITPLWYTCWARWMKVAFWRRHPSVDLTALDTTEPYRRLNSHLYFNSQFIAALAMPPHGVADEALPVRWRRPDTGTLQPIIAGKARMLRFRLWWWHRQLTRIPTALDPWRRLMHLDRLGHRLARFSLTVLLAPDSPQVRPLSRSEHRLLAGAPSVQDAGGLDPVWRYGQGEIPKTDAGALWREPLAAVLNDSRARFSAHFSQALQVLAQQLQQRGQLSRIEDIHFCFFDELWELWFDPTRRLPEAKIQDRKMRYMADAHAGPPDWLIDGKAYGASPFHDQQLQPLLRGDCLVPGEVRGTIRKIFSAWQLNLVQPGDIVVLHHAESGWLRSLAMAGGFILAHRQPQDPVAAYARQFAVPAIWQVPDALHSLKDGVNVTLVAEQGKVFLH